MRGASIGRVTVVSMLVAALAGGCITTTNLNSPNAVPEDAFTYTLGFTTIQEIGIGSPIMAFRWGMGDGLDVGAGIDMLTTKLDVRYQFLNSESHFVDANVEAGMGLLLFVFPTYYAGVGLGLDFGSAERGISPYVSYRWTGLSLIETSELEEEDDDDDDDFEFTGLDGWGQVCVGVELRVSRKTAIVAEYCMLTDLETSEGEHPTTLSVGIRIGKF